MYRHKRKRSRKTGDKDGFRGSEAIKYYYNSKVFCPKASNVENFS